MCHRGPQGGEIAHVVAGKAACEVGGVIPELSSTTVISGSTVMGVQTGGLENAQEVAQGLALRDRRHAGSGWLTSRTTWLDRSNGTSVLPRTGPCPS